jgi:hypothetical protein
MHEYLNLECESQWAGLIRDICFHAITAYYAQLRPQYRPAIQNYGRNSGRYLIAIIVIDRYRYYRYNYDRYRSYLLPCSSSSRRTDIQCHLCLSSCVRACVTSNIDDGHRPAEEANYCLAIHWPHFC